MSGARGVGAEIQHLEADYAGYPERAAPLMRPTCMSARPATKVKNTLVAGDVLALSTINKLRTKAKKMLGGQPDKAVKMAPISMGGKKVFCLATCPEGIQDIRDDAGAQGWFEAQKALTTAIGKESEIFKGRRWHVQWRAGGRDGDLREVCGLRRWRQRPGCALAVPRVERRLHRPRHQGAWPTA